MNKDAYKLYQLLSFFVMKFSFKPARIANLKDDELFIINPTHQYFPVIRLTTSSIEQVMFNKERIDTIVGAIKKQLHLNNVRLLDIHIGNDEVTAFETYDSIVLNTDYYSGIEVSDYFPGIKRCIHDVSNPDLEIKAILEELKDYNKAAVKQKRNIKSMVRGQVVTKITMFICFFMYFITFFLGKKYGEINADIFLGANYKMFTVGLGEFWRLLTCGFLHGSIFHLFVNMMSLYVLGNALEKELGTLKYSLALFGSVIIASLTSLMLGENTVSVGLSGGLYGLMVIYLILAYKNGYLSSQGTFQIVFVNLAINLMGGVDIYAHLGGLIAGLVFYMIYYNNKYFSILYIALILVLGFKVYTVDMIDPKYGGTDRAVVEIYRDLGLDNIADKLDEKLFDVYTNR